jgi:hypothetical protein
MSNTDLNDECPFSGMNEWECDRDDTPDGMSTAHVAWHTNKLIDAGKIVVIAESINREQRDKVMVLAETWAEWEK